MNYEVTIKQLKCNETEDTLGADECRLEIYADGKRIRSRRRNLNDGQKWTLNQRVRFNASSLLKLWDEDSPDPDDFLGQVSIPAHDGSYTGRFRRDGADYSVTYSVRRLQATDQRVPKHIKIDLLTVHCHDTEDMTGADEFYVVGGVRVGKESSSLITKPMPINDGQVRSFLPDERELYNGSVKADDMLSVGLVAFDSDAVSAWAQNAANIQEAIDDLADSIGKLGEQVEVGAEIAKASVKVIGELVNLDVDDELDREAVDLRVRDIPIGTSSHNWTFSGELLGGIFGWSTWHYNVVIRVTAR